MASMSDSEISSSAHALTGDSFSAAADAPPSARARRTRRLETSLGICIVARLNTRALLSGRLPQLRNHPERSVAAGDTLDIVKGVAEAPPPALPRRARHVRRDRHGLEREQRVVQGRRLLEHDVEPRAGDL